MGKEIYLAMVTEVQECKQLHHAWLQPKQAQVCLLRHREHGEHRHGKWESNAAFVAER